MQFEEQQYLNLVRNIILNGTEKNNRTGIPTYSIFGNMMRFDISDYKIPLLTTKYVNFKNILDELLWFLSGSSDAKKLSTKIWEPNTTREFLDKRGLSQFREGDAGMNYGMLWRHFGTEYNGCDVDYDGKGFDQIAEAINLLKTDPDSRRIIVSAWDPTTLDKVALPPCHNWFQFYTNNRKLSILVNQRSADVPLGVPYNIASYSILAHIIAEIVNMKAVELIYVTGDTHIYKNQLEGCHILLRRQPIYQFPTIKFNKKIDDIDNIKISDIELCDYQHQGSIKFEFAI